MVVMCGTATTIDFLTGDGVFKGGVIMPGVGLMLRSLHEGTAALPDQDGEFFAYPTQTVDAIASGCQHAQAGAIERLFANEQRVQTPDVVCVLSGGAAGAVAPRLVDSVPAAREPRARGAVPDQPVAVGRARARRVAAASSRRALRLPYESALLHEAEQLRRVHVLDRALLEELRHLVVA